MGSTWQVDVLWKRSYLSLPVINLYWKDILWFFSILKYLKFDECQNSVSIVGCTAHLRWTRACLLHGNIIRSPSKTPCTLTNLQTKVHIRSDWEENLCKGFNFDDPTCIAEVTLERLLDALQAALLGHQGQPWKRRRLSETVLDKSMDEETNKWINKSW